LKNKYLFRKIFFTLNSLGFKKALHHQGKINTIKEFVDERKCSENLDHSV